MEIGEAQKETVQCAGRRKAAEISKTAANRGIMNEARSVGAERYSVASIGIYREISGFIPIFRLESTKPPFGSPG